MAVARAAGSLMALRHRKRYFRAHVPRNRSALDVGVLPSRGRMEYVSLPEQTLCFMIWFADTSRETVRNTHGPGPDDVLLGEYNHKFDAD